MSKSEKSEIAKEIVYDIVDTLENFNLGTWRHSGYLDSIIGSRINESIIEAIHDIADELSHKYKIGNYANREE